MNNISRAGSNTGKRQGSNFIIIGVAKSGTTALYQYLSEHPDIFMSHLKETNFFAYSAGDKQQNINNEFNIKNWEQYCALFDDATDGQLTGEASPLYFESNIAPKNIKSTLPEVKLILSLRNPVDRAFSGYLMHLRNGRAKTDINNAFTIDKHYVQAGFYADRIANYLVHFPRDQIKIVLFYDLVKSPISVCSEIFSFLGVDKSFVPNIGVKHNEGSYPISSVMNYIINLGARFKILRRILPRFLLVTVKSLKEKNLGPKPEISVKVKDRLKALYRDDIQQTSQIIEKDLSRWL